MLSRFATESRFRSPRAFSIKADSNITNESFEMMDTGEATSPEDKRIQGILSYFDDNIAKPKALDLLHSLLVVSHDILTWNFRGEIVYFAKTIPNTNIVDQFEYCLCPYDVNIPEPPGFYVFVKELAAIRIDKEYIENAHVLAMPAREGEEERDDDLEEETDVKKRKVNKQKMKETTMTQPLRKPRQKCVSIVKIPPHRQCILGGCASM